jgi:putative transposase
MTEKRTWTEEQKLAILEEATKNGVAETTRKYGLYPATFYAWKQKHEKEGVSGLSPQYIKRQSKQSRELKQENALLKKLLAEKELELAMAKEVIKKSLQPKWTGNHGLGDSPNNRGLNHS